MARSKIYVGLEIGTSKICVVVGEVKTDASIRILGVGHSSSAGVRKGEIVDFEQAQTCLNKAIYQAEERSDVTIREVILAVTGSHVRSINNRGCFRIPDDQDVISVEDLDEVKEIARDVGIPQQNVHLHSIIRQYLVDGQDGIIDPIGMAGRRLEADYHIVHGLRNRVQNTIRCIKELRLGVEDVVFAPVASAQVALTQESMKRGTLLIDFGGGTADYVLFADGAVALSGCVPVGGDHITSDLAVVLKIPQFRAETLKVNEGHAWPADGGGSGIIHLKDDNGVAGPEVDRETTNLIIYHRLRETFEIIREQVGGGDHLARISGGVHLTGGVSHTKGIEKVAEEVFGMPVQKTAAAPLSGLASTVENPEYSAAIGLIRYAQILDAERPPTSAFDVIRNKLNNLLGKTRSLLIPFFF